MVGGINDVDGLGTLDSLERRWATVRERGEFRLKIRVRDGYQDYEIDYHPFDVVGWDGYLYPWTFSIHDFEPITGRIHMPPPSHQTFQGPNFVICSFCPRKLDFDPLAVPIPYHHSNLQSEEMIYYVDGNFSSRKGIEIGSITLHPTGIPHGPQPGLAEKSIGMTETHELAVMCDTFHPLRLGKLAEGLDESHALNVTNSAAELDNTDVRLLVGVVDRDLGDLANPLLNRASDVGHDLYRLAQVVSAALPLDDLGVDLAESDVVIPGEGDIEVALIVSQVKIDLSTIIQNVDFTVLFRVHGAGVGVDVRVDLDARDLQAHSLEQQAGGRGLDM